MSSEESIRDALLYVGYGQLKDGLFEDAVDTFAAVCILNPDDHHALRGRELAFSQITSETAPAFSR